MSNYFVLGQAEAAVARKRAEVAGLFDEANAAADPHKREELANSIKSANTELQTLIDKVMSVKADIAGHRPVNRQIDQADDNPVGSWSSDEPEPGVVRALKSGEKFADLYGGSTPVTLDAYLRAAITNDWSRIPEGLFSSFGRKSMGTDALGDLTLPVPLANRIIDLSRAASQVVNAGASTFRMDNGTETIARLKTDPVASWKSQNALITASDAAFEPVQLVARTLAARVVMSVELAEDAPSIGNATESALASALANELDRSALLGSGTPPEPKGLINTAGVAVVDTSAGLSANYADFSRAVQAIREANGEPNAVIYGPDVAGELERLIDGNGNPIGQPESFRGLSKYVTSKMADTAAIGYWPEFLIGMRQEVRIEAERLANDENGLGFSSYSVLVRATLRADFAVLKPSHFYVLTDINATGS